VSTYHWIVCDRSNRWAAALRVALARQPWQSGGTVAVHQLRGLDELSAELVKFPKGLALIETTSKNFDATLTWLSAATRRTRHSAIIALLDNSVTSRADVADALREAGAAEVAYSPRELQPALRLAMQHFSKIQVGEGLQIQADQPLADWAWSLLPWQDARLPVG
jgi:hypothetical protein